MNANDSFLIFDKARTQLKTALTKPVVDDRDRAGVIQMFEFTFEACWKYLRTRLQEVGIQAQNPRSAFEEAIQQGWIQDANAWASLLKDRNLTVHTYDEKLAEQILSRIQSDYLTRFLAILKP